MSNTNFFADHKKVIQFAVVALLLIGCVSVLLPFTGTLLFAVVICITTSRMRRWLLYLCRGRRTPAALLMSLMLLLILATPVALLSGAVVQGVETAVENVRPILDSGLPNKPPQWLADLPGVGKEVTHYWRSLVRSRDAMNELLHQSVEPARRFALATAKLLGQGILQLVLVIFFVFFIFRDADTYMEALHNGSRKLAGRLGDRMLQLIDDTVTGVMVGIVGTAAGQAFVAMIGFLIAGVPAVLLLTFATFIFSMVPVIGATLIWLGAAGWLYETGQTNWAVFMILWGMFGISGVDNLIKPILISRTSSLPLLLIIVGVFGGVLVFGFIGLFLGPTLLALGQVLVREWLGLPVNNGSRRQ